jgi:HK97 family phage prohead protease
MIQFKNIGLKVMDLDENHRKVLVYVSAFNNKDSDNDIILPGAFKKTLEERGPMSDHLRIKHLRDHWNLIGKPLEMSEDETGLLVLSQLSNSTAGRDTIEDYKLNLLEHSIGFEIIKRTVDEEDEVQYLKELKLWEYSSVTWGANSQTPLVALKGIEPKEQIKRLNNKMDRLTNAMKSGNYTDERFEEIELQLNIVKKSYNDIIDSLMKPAPGATSEKPNYKTLDESFNNFKKLIA